MHETLIAFSIDCQPNKRQRFPSTWKPAENLFFKNVVVKHLSCNKAFTAEIDSVKMLVESKMFPFTSFWEAF
jgi:hypothetical protein